MRGETVLHDVRYHITVYQEVHRPRPDMPPTLGMPEIRGSISPIGEVRPSALMRQEFTLHLDDGRRLDLHLGPNGEILPRSEIRVAIQ